MRRILSFLAGGAFAALLIVAPVVYVALQSGTPDKLADAPEPQPKVQAPEPPTGDPGVTTARTRARASLGIFQTLAAADGVRRFKIQALLPAAGGGEEAIWMTDCESGGPADYICVVEESPSRPEVGPGDAYAVAKNDIADWLVETGDGRLHGGYTIRAMLPKMDPAERARLLPRLAPLPAN